MVDNLVRLFDENDSVFVTHGLGIITDAVSCTVDEELNGQFELTMEYPVDGEMYRDIKLRQLIVTKPNPYANPQAFRIYSIETPINGIITVHAQHISYDMSGYILDPTKSYDDTIEANNLADHMRVFEAFSEPDVTKVFRFLYDRDIKPRVEDEKFEYESRTVIKTPLSARGFLGDHVLGNFKAETIFDNYTVELVSERGKDNGVLIAYGKNITDFNQEANNAEMVTKVYPYYSSGDVLVSLTTDPEYGYTSNMISVVDAGYVKTAALDLSSEFSEVPSSGELHDAAMRYIQEHELFKPKISITVSFVDLAKIAEYEELAALETVELGDTVHIVFDKFKITSESRVISYNYDCLADRYLSINLGDKEATLTDTVVQITADSVTKTEAQFIANNSSALITGNKGGYVVMHDNDGDGKPDEILVMDTESPLTAQKVWRWNKGGLGYSNTGYNGNYGLAMTIDGAINCDFLRAGTITGRAINNGNGTFSVDEVGNLRAFAAVLDGMLNAQRISTNSGKFSVDENGIMKAVEAILQNVKSEGGEFTNLTAVNMIATGGTFDDINITSGNIELYGLKEQARVRIYSTSSSDKALFSSFGVQLSDGEMSVNLNRNYLIFDSGSERIIQMRGDNGNITTKGKINAIDGFSSLDGNVSLTHGNVNLTDGNVSTVKGDVIAGGVSLKEHTHAASKITTTFKGQGDVYHALVWLNDRIDAVAAAASSKS